MALRADLVFDARETLTRAGA